MADPQKAPQSLGPVREERFEHGGVALSLLLPASAEALIDEAEFAVDERLPYWAELWPSARGLAKWILDAAPLRGRVLELGAGVGLPSLAALRRGAASVMVSDWYAAALEFAKANAARNALGEPATAVLDWSKPAEYLGQFDVVLGADLLYERRNAASLAAALDRFVTPAGRAIIADPGRTYLPEFIERMKQGGWSVEPIATSPHPVGNGATVTVQLLELKRGV